MSNPLHAEMLADLRKQICLHLAPEPMVLHEGHLAERYGVSRTPVREVMAMLAYQSMVETRPGVGTIVVPLDPARKITDIQSYIAMCRAAAYCAEGRPIERSVQLAVISLAHELELTETRTVEDLVNMVASVIDAMGLLVTDPIVRDAMQATHWRLLRWRAREAAENPDRAWSGMAANMALGAEAVREGDAASVLMASAAFGSKFIDDTPSESEPAE